MLRQVVIAICVVSTCCLVSLAKDKFQTGPQKETISFSAVNTVKGPAVQVRSGDVRLITTQLTLQRTDETDVEFKAVKGLIRWTGVKHTFEAKEIIIPLRSAQRQIKAR